jgi:DNA-binding Lrp family transcriptional regulator
MAKAEQAFTALERRLLDAYQRGFPLSPRPFAEIAEREGVRERDVLDAFERLQAAGAVSRVGAVVRPHAAGSSTLAALAVPADRLEAVAEQVSAHPQVNHNYEREHAYNLWFVVTGRDAHEVAGVLAAIARETGVEPLDLPLEEPFHIDLGFQLQWR